MGEYNVVDLAIALVLAFFALAGLRRGLLAGAADLAAIAVAFVLAIKGYGLVSEVVTRATDVPRLLANFVALIALFLLFEWLLGYAINWGLGLVRPLLVGPVRLADRAGGVLPGLLKGLLVAAAMIALADSLPLHAALRAPLQESTLGSQLTRAVRAAAVSLEANLGGSEHDTALFVTPPSEREEARRMSFPRDLAVAVDPDAERRMVALVNEERAKAGLRPLVVDEGLRAAARAHSEDMFREAYFAHESLDGRTPAERVKAAGVRFVAMGENLAYAPNVDVAHTGLMNSPGHRRNILSPAFGRVGIGVVEGGIYGKMFSQEFAN